MPEVATKFVPDPVSLAASQFGNNASAPEPAPAPVDEERAHLLSIVKRLDAGLIEATPDLTITRWNPRAEEIFGFTEAEALGAKLDLIVPPDLMGQTRSVEEVLREGKTAEYDTKRRKKSGELIDIRLAVVPVYGASGNCVGVAGLSHDITAQRLLERELNETQSYTRSLFESSIDPMVVVAPDLTISDINEQMTKLVGKQRTTLVGTPFKNCFTDPEKAEDSIKQAVASGYITNCELVVRTYGQSSVPVSLNASLLRDSRGNVRGIFALVRDISGQKEMEHRLQQLQSYTRGLIESSVDAMVVVDEKLVISDVNEQMARLAEVPKTTLVGSRFDAYFEDRERAAAGVQKTLAEGFVTNYDLTLKQPGGGERLVSFNASVFRDSSGNVGGIFAVARDVTEQRRVESQLRELQLYGRSLIEASNEALFVVEPQGQIIDVNEQSCKITGYTRDDLIGSPFASLFTDLARTKMGIEQTLKAGFVQDFGLNLITFTGAQIPVSFNASLFRGADGNIKGIFAAAREVTERQRQEREHALLASIVGVSKDAIYSESPDLIVTGWNKAAQEPYGYTAEEMIGKSVLATVPLPKRAELMQINSQLRESGQAAHFETVRLRKDGTTVDVSITMALMRDAEGKITGIAVTARDITERKRIEQELIEARDAALEGGRLKSEFLANMSHEIRTPLNSIIGVTGLLIDSPLNSEQLELLADVEKSGEALLGVINDVLDFSKISVGKLIFENIDFDLMECVDGCVDIVGETARAKELELMISVDPDIPRWLNGDPGRLRQVLLNLLSNALKFTERGEVQIKASRIAENERDAMLRFEVIDTGIGIPQDAQRWLFQPFSQPGPASRRLGGAGLGLAIAAKLVENMEGKIGVISTPGVGSTFWFAVKFTKARTAKPLPPEAEVLKGLNVLVVDDNPRSLEALLRMLGHWEIQADIASDAVEGLAKLRARAHDHPYKLALVDMEMPGANGLELCRWIRNDPTIAGTDIIIASSGGNGPEIDSAARALNAKAVLRRPLRQSELYNRLLQIGEFKEGAPQTGTEALRAAPPQTRPASGALNAPVSGAAMIVNPVRPIESQPVQLRPMPHDHRGRILVAEDNPINIKVALRQLTKLGYAADGVGNGREAVEASSKLPYNAILMDYQMPEMDGYEATRRIRWLEGKKGRHVPIIAMTAHAMTGDRDRCIEAGMDDYISKPVKLDALDQVLQRNLFNTQSGSAVEPPKTVLTQLEPQFETPVTIDAAAPASPQEAPTKLEALDGPSGQAPTSQLAEAAAEQVAARPAGSDPVLDSQIIQELRDEGQDLLDHLIETFTHIVPAQIEQLADEFARGDLKAASTGAHSLKGSVANLGAMRMRATCATLDTMARNGTVEDVASLLDELRAEYQQASVALAAEHSPPTNDTAR